MRTLWLTFLSFLLFQTAGISNAHSQSNLSSLKKILEERKSAYDAKSEDFQVLLNLVRAYNDVGESFNDDGKKDEASPYFQNAQKFVKILDGKFPNRAEVFYYRAVITGNLSDYADSGKQIKMGHAIEKFAKRAIELDPKFEPSYVVLGSFYREISELNSFEKWVFGKVSGANLANSEKLLRKAIQLKPSDPFAHFELAETLLKQGRFNEARQSFKKVISLPLSDPRHAHLKKQATERLSGR